jgi:uncharacterized phage-associated protein
MMTVQAQDVAVEIRRRHPSIGAKKLHKLLYYCQGHHLATFGTPLFSDTISAWDMGPVVGTLWHNEKEAVAAPSAVLMDEAGLNTVGYVLSRYGALSGSDLEHLTHSEDPWLQANARRSPGTSARISAESITSYFRRTEAEDDEHDTLLPDVDEVAAWLKGADDRRDEVGRPDSVEDLRARLRSSA